MSPVMRFIRRLLVLFSFAGLSATPAWADYPDFTAGANVQPPQADRPASSLRPVDTPGSLRPLDADSASRKYPIRFPASDRHAAALPASAAEGADAPQRLVAHQRAIPLPRPSGESLARLPTAEHSAWLTGMTSLGIVLGLFLLVVWSVRRAAPRAPSRLPREAVEILGRAPLVGRQQVHLVRCGNKILLLTVTATSVETLTEITEPEEVDRLVEICQTAGPGGVSASIRQVFQHFGRPSGLDYYSDRDTDGLDFGHLETEIDHRTREARV